MANPFTRFIRANHRDKPLDRFIEGWDAIEERCIATYRAGAFTTVEAEEWIKLRKRVFRSYERVADRLAPHWKLATINGRPTAEDPFRWILNVEELGAVIGNWQLLQHLPPAREAINRCILSNKARS